MFGWLLGKPKVTRAAEALYARIVDAARAPRFYTELGVADTTEGRFEMVALHLFLALEALKVSPLDAAFRDTLMQRTIEAFVTDMDDCMREMAVGDLTVPKKVKRAAAGFYERTGAYRAALASNDREQLAVVLSGFIYLVPEAHGYARALAAYVDETAQRIKGASPETMFEARPGASEDQAAATRTTERA